MRLGEILRLWRRVSNITIRDLAAEIGVPYPTLSRIERGKEMDGTTLAKILAWLMEPAKETSFERNAAHRIVVRAREGL